MLAFACVSCSYGAEPDRHADYVIYYTGQSSELDHTSLATVGHAAEAAARAPSFDLVVAGFADDPGAPEANQIQSRIRAQTVADALLRAGVARDRVTLTPRRALGGDPAIESRRVDIRLGS